MSSGDALVVDIANFSAWYEKGRPIMGGSHFAIPAGKAVGLLGGNGAGKTTFIRGITGLLQGWSAESFVSSGRELSADDKAFKSQRYAVFAEDRSFPLWTFTDLLKYLHSVYAREIDGQLVDSLVSGFSFEPHLASRLSELSSGNNKKARLICAFALGLPLLILDEPVDFLDFTGTEFLYESINAYVDEGHSILMSSHIAESFVRCCDLMYILQHGALSGPQPVPAEAQGIVKLLDEQLDEKVDDD